MKQRLASLALLAVAASWGLTFVTMKDALNRQSVNSFLFYRFSQYVHNARNAKQI